jgi:hypothetical protein
MPVGNDPAHHAFGHWVTAWPVGVTMNKANALMVMQTSQAFIPIHIHNLFCLHCLGRLTFLAKGRCKRRSAY